MAAQQGGGSLLSKIAGRTKAAVLGAADKPVETGQIDIPPGIRNGIMQVTDLGFFPTKPESEQKKADGSSAAGEPYFQVTASIMEPFDVEVNGRRVKCKGLQDRLYIPCFDTKTQDGKVTTLEEHLTSARKNVLNELKKLGATPAMIKSLGGDVEKIAATLKAVATDKNKGIFFSFSTSPKYAQGDTAKTTPTGSWVNWNGREGLENYKPGAPNAKEQLDETAHDPRPAESGKVAAQIMNNKPAPPPPPAAEYRDDTDIDSLLARTRGDGTDAQEACDALRELAKAKGKTDEDVDNADNWEQVVMWINGGGGAAAETPAVEDVFLITLDGKQVEVEVQTVDETAKTVTLKDMDKKAVINDKKTKKPRAFGFAELTPRA